MARLAFAIALTAAVLASSSPTARVSAEGAAPCRFGITAPLGSQGYDLQSLGVGSYLDWTADGHPVLPPGVEYIRVLRVSDGSYPAVLASLPALVQANPGAVWLVGNEPDRVQYQDSVTPEVYGERFFELANVIRTNDPTARLGFATIVQPTPIRLLYLDRAWIRLVQLAHSQAAASNLIDIWSIHAFILNETPSWGADIPPGMEADRALAVARSFSDTHSNVLFNDGIIAFRRWLNDKGERNKPLWITEYGSLFPSTIPELGVPDSATVSFMLGTFDFLLSAQDATTGLPTDGNRLVQRWFWYSLNDHRDNFGGSLFDPDIGNQITPVGQAFMDYSSLSLAQPDLSPLAVEAIPRSYANSEHSLVNYYLQVRVGNALSADTSSGAQVWIYDSNPASGGVLIGGPVTIARVGRCGGSALAPFITWDNIPPNYPRNLYVAVAPIGRDDLDPQDNQASFEVTPGVPYLFFLPQIMN
ncbi:MAG: hypothetical protein PHQ40_06620 [Anaerolineaceae bacterium]|nr:hypothetical protein [Anaerolineaceae bacterium]